MIEGKQRVVNLEKQMQSMASNGKRDLKRKLVDNIQLKRGGGKK